VDYSETKLRKEESDPSEQAVAPLSQTADKEQEMGHLMKTNKQQLRKDVISTNKSSAVETMRMEKSSADTKKPQKEEYKNGRNMKKENAVKPTKKKHAKTEQKQKEPEKVAKAIATKSEQRLEDPEKGVKEDQTLQLVHAKEKKHIKVEAATFNVAKVTIDSLRLQDSDCKDLDQNLDSIASMPERDSTGDSSSGEGGDFSLGDDNGEWTTVGMRGHANGSRRKENARTTLHSSSSLSTPRSSGSKENLSKKSETRQEHVEESRVKGKKTKKIESKAMNTPETNAGEPSASSPDMKMEQKEKMGKKFDASDSNIEKSENSKKPSQEQQPSEEDPKTEPSDAAKMPSQEQQPKTGKEPNLAPQLTPSEEDDAALASMLQKEEEMVAKAEQLTSSTNEEWEEVTSKRERTRRTNMLMAPMKVKTVF